jgi:orotate phosphoribosyltransferase
VENWTPSFVKFLVLHGILTFGSFKLKSGRVSPYYFNLRRISDGQTLSALAAYYTRKIVDDIGMDKFDAIFGPSYAGIPLALGVATELWRKHKTIKRYAFDRKEEKLHGNPEDRIIGGGSLCEGDRVLVIDDVITTGETKVECIRKLRSLKLRLSFVGILVAFDRLELDENGVYAGEVLEKGGLRLFSMVDAPSTFFYLSNRRIQGRIYVTNSEIDSFNDYFRKYGFNQAKLTSIARE